MHAVPQAETCAARSDDGFASDAETVVPLAMKRNPSQQLLSAASSRDASPRPKPSRQRMLGLAERMAEAEKIDAHCGQAPAGSQAPSVHLPPPSFPPHTEPAAPSCAPEFVCQPVTRAQSAEATSRKHRQAEVSALLKLLSLLLPLVVIVAALVRIVEMAESSSTGGMGIPNPGEGENT